MSDRITNPAQHTGFQFPSVHFEQLVELGLWDTLYAKSWFTLKQEN